MTRIGGSPQTRWLSLYFLALALACLAASVVGLITARPGMAIIGFPLFAFMLLVSLGLSRSRQLRSDDRLVAGQERFFRRLGIKWLSGDAPDKDQPAEPKNH